MKLLKAVAPDDQRYTGKLIADDIEFEMVATQVPVGGYQLQEYRDISSSAQDVQIFYGSHMLVFKSEGSTVVVIHGGVHDADGLLRPTHGNIRLSDNDMARLVDYIGNDQSVVLEVVPEHVGVFKRLARQPVSSERLRTPQSMRQDDSSLTGNLLLLYWLSHDTGNASGQEQPPAATEFAAGDGQFGGAGAGASFETPADSNRPHESHAADQPTPPLIVDPFSAQSEPNEKPADIILEDPETAGQATTPEPDNLGPGNVSDGGTSY